MTARKFAGYLCVALSFALILLLGYGVIDPIGGSLAQVTTMRDALIGLVPSVLMAVGVFVIGLWLLKGPRRNGAAKK